MLQSNKAFHVTHPRCARVFPCSLRSLGARERRRYADAHGHWWAREERVSATVHKLAGHEHSNTQ